MTFSSFPTTGAEELPSILFLDDDFEVLKVLQMSLEDSGFAATIAPTPDEAERLIREKEFDLIVCDLIMPGISGIEFWKKISSELVNHPPILFSSGVPLDPFSADYPRGVAGFFPKPYTVRELVQKVHSLLLQ